MTDRKCCVQDCNEDAVFAFSNGEPYSENYSCTNHFDDLTDEEKIVSYTI